MMSIALFHGGARFITKLASQTLLWLVTKHSYFHLTYRYFSCPLLFFIYYYLINDSILMDFFFFNTLFFFL